MSDPKDPQDLNPEEQNNPEQEIKDLKLIKIAISYMTREIADDTPSELNGLTALDQLIAYEFGIEDDKKFYENLERFKESVIFQAQCLEEEDEEEVEMYVSDKEGVVRRLAIYTLVGLVTDDVVSRWPEYTSLEQIIMYEWGDIEDEEIKEIKKKIKAEQLVIRGGRALCDKKEFDDFAKPKNFYLD